MSRKREGKSIDERVKAEALALRRFCGMVGDACANRSKPADFDAIAKECGLFDLLDHYDLKLDPFTERHLMEWLDRTVHVYERFAVEAGMRRVLSEHPDLIERGYSWPEIRGMAEGAGYIKLAGECIEDAPSR